MLLMRVITALVLAPLFLAGIFFLPANGFALFIGAFLLLAGWEWGGLCGFERPGRVLLSALLALAALGIWWFDAWLPAAAVGSAFWVLALVAVASYPAARTQWQRPAVRTAAGVLMLLPAWSGLTLLQARDGGAWLVLWTMVAVWAADIGAYFAGRAFGRHKLAPSVSPGKTVEGMAGGVLAALLLSMAIAGAGGIDGTAAFALVMIVALLVICASVVGDLMESLVKRVAGVKDSGTLLPGHGGVLDRIDAVLAAAPVAALLLTLLDVVPAGLLARWYS